MLSRLLAVGFLGVAIGAAGFWLATDAGDQRVRPAPTPGEATDRSVDWPRAVPSAQRSLAQIVDTATDFQRNTALYALLADTGPDEVEALLAEVEALAPAPHRVHEAILALDTIPAHLQQEARVGLVNALSSFRNPSGVDFQIVLDWYRTLESSSRQLAGALAKRLCGTRPRTGLRLGPDTGGPCAKCRN